MVCLHKAFVTIAGMITKKGVSPRLLSDFRRSDLATSDSYDKADIASRIIPCVSLTLVDTEK
jgi:hypothetical protein